MHNIVKLADNSRVYEVASVSDLNKAPSLSALTQNQIYFKREDKQSVHSFKCRGAHQKISSLSESELARGVVTASAGNHAQGVALSAQKLGIQAIIVMPTSTPKIKLKAVEHLQAKIVLHGDVYDDAYAYAKILERSQNLVFIHPYDDIQVMAGTATIGKELLAQLPEMDVVFIPVGGGGLIAGIATYLKHYAPQIKVIGVEPRDSPTLHLSLKYGKRIVLPEVGRFADGVAVKQIGALAFEMVKGLVNEVVLVSNDEICAAIKDIYEDVRSIAEPSGALATAGAKKYIAEHALKNQHIVTIISGANVNFDRLRYIAERAELGENNEMIIAANIDERPGSFLQFCELLNNRAITEFNYRYGSSKHAKIFVGIALSGEQSEKMDLLKTLRQSFEVVDMSQNSIAKNHIRYMVGGRAQMESELLYRFEFPERPGALLKFLRNIGIRWNISLFHYRNHGADFGRILIGFQTDDVQQLEKNFEQLGYFFKNETDNPAYHYFL